MLDQELIEIRTSAVWALEQVWNYVRTVCDALQIPVDAAVQESELALERASDDAARFKLWVQLSQLLPDPAPVALAVATRLLQADRGVHDVAQGRAGSAKATFQEHWPVGTADQSLLRNLREKHSAEMGRKLASCNARLRSLRQAEEDGAALRIEVRMLEARLAEEVAWRRTLQGRLHSKGGEATPSKPPTPQGFTPCSSYLPPAPTSARSGRGTTGVPSVQASGGCPAAALPDELLQELGLVLRRLVVGLGSSAAELPQPAPQRRGGHFEVGRQTLDLEAHVWDVQRRCASAWRTPGVRRVSLEVERNGQGNLLQMGAERRKVRLAVGEDGSLLCALLNGSYVPLELLLLLHELNNIAHSVGLGMSTGIYEEDDYEDDYEEDECDELEGTARAVPVPRPPAPVSPLPLPPVLAAAMPPAPAGAFYPMAAAVGVATLRPALGMGQYPFAVPTGPALVPMPSSATLSHCASSCGAFAQPTGPVARPNVVPGLLTNTHRLAATAGMAMPVAVHAPVPVASAPTPRAFAGGMVVPGMTATRLLPPQHTVLLSRQPM